MDELELRRRCLADPRSADPEFRQALERQPAARRAAEQALRLDQALRAALQQTAVPEGLDDRILLRLGLQQTRRRRRSTGLALAASLLLALAVALWPQPRPASFGAMALAHVYDEIDHLEHLPAGTVADGTLATLVREVGAELQGRLEAVRFAYICPTPRGPGLHLITDGPDGPVTVLYVPGAGSAQDEERFADERFTGLAHAVPGGGTLAVIGESRDDVRSVRERVQRQLRWPAAQAAAGAGRTA